MKVKDIITFLQEYPPEMEIKFATGSEVEAFWLSDYTDDTDTFVWVDIGNE